MARPTIRNRSCSATARRAWSAISGSLTGTQPPPGTEGSASPGGRYIAFLDSDDEWLPEKLEKQVAILEGAPATTGLVYATCSASSRQVALASFPAPEVRQGETFSPRTNDYQWRGIGIQSTLIRRQCFEEDRFFDENLFALCDLDSVRTSLGAAFDLHHLPEPLVRYYAGPGISTNMAAIAAAREHMLAKYRRAVRRAPQASRLPVCEDLGGPSPQRGHEVGPGLCAAGRSSSIPIESAGPRAITGRACWERTCPHGVYRRLAAILPAGRGVAPTLVTLTATSSGSARPM